jgi:predicted Zn-dependent protease
MVKVMRITVEYTSCDENVNLDQIFNDIADRINECKDVIDTADITIEEDTFDDSMKHTIAPSRTILIEGLPESCSKRVL